MPQNTSHPKERWKRIYTIVLVANIIYIVLFWIITSSYH